MKTRLAWLGGAVALGPILMMACGGSVDSSLFGTGATSSSGGTSSGQTTSTSSGTASSSSGHGGASSSSTSSGSTSTSSTSTSTSSTSTSSTSTSTSSSSGGPCLSSPNDDADLDGWTVAQGDCNDCDPLVNPGAVELQNGLDDDCNGQIDDLPLPCDQGIAIDIADPNQAVKAVELCKVSNGSKVWGVTGAKWVMADGSAPPAGMPNFDLGHGVLPGLGPNVHVQLGQSMLALSSGTARAPTDPGYQDVAGFDKALTGNSPQGFPKESASCPGIVTGAPHDPAGLEVTIKAPSNATGFSYDSNFFTYEWPAYVCSAYNDFFVAILAPIPLGQTDGNIASDGMGNPMSVNSGLLSVCGCMPAPPCTAGNKSFACPLGSASLVGTGFEGMTEVHGATGWLTTTAPAKGGDVITLRWAVYDSNDGVEDTTALIDHWQWLGGPGVVVGTSASPNPK